MRIENSTSPNFSAKFINKTAIGKKDFYPNYFSEQVSFVRIEPQNSSDIKALEQVSKFWIYGGLAKNVYYMACAIRNKSKYYKNHEVYALTSQNDNFEKLDSRKILGVAGTCPENKDKLFIEYIQANPQEIYAIEPEYRGIGSAILDSLKNLFSKIYCYPSNTDSVINFYTKNGFQKKQNALNHYFWEK